MFHLTDGEIKTLILSCIISVLAVMATAMFSGKDIDPAQKIKNFVGGFCAGLIVAILNMVNDWNPVLEYIAVFFMSAFGNVLWPALSAFSLKYVKKKTNDTLHNP